MNPVLTMLLVLISIAFPLIWTYVLFRTGQSRGRTALFYVLLYAPLVLGTLWNIIVAPEAILAFFGILGAWGIIAILIFALERIGWGFTLKEISGEDRLVWFYIAYWVPFFGWFLYRLVNIR